MNSYNGFPKSQLYAFLRIKTTVASERTQIKTSVRATCLVTFHSTSEPTFSGNSPVYTHWQRIVYEVIPACLPLGQVIKASSAAECILAKLLGPQLVWSARDYGCPR